ncbi:MAG: hypothetical protein PHS14_14735, partial [Elusimicrobia bacterium]|nr:hypothetical protein [Elusimicrobiota bacterium]
MIRALIAVLVINSFPAPALAQVVRVAGPVRMSLAVPALSAAPGAFAGLTPVLSGPLPMLSAPSVVAAPVPALAAPAALLPLMPAAAVPAKPGIHPERALTAAKTAAASAAEFAASPGSLEFDRSRADFADGSVRRAAFVEAVVSAVSPVRLWAALRPSARAASSGASRPMPPVPPAAAPRLAPFLGGTFLAQVASNALQVTMPLLILQVTGSAAAAAFAATLSSA